jgi:spectinomycin phosphotransferase
MSQPALVEWVRDEFDVALVRLDPVHGGVDDRAQVSRGCTADGDEYAVKVTGGGSDAGLALPAHLAAHNVPGVAAPLRTRTGALWSQRADLRLSLTPWLGSRRGVDVALAADQWRDLGVLLATLHRTPVPDDVRLPIEPHQPDAATAVIDHVWATLGSDRSFDAVSQEVQRLWNDSRAAIDAVVRRAEQLAPALRERPSSRVICHADPHVGNVVLDDHDRVWLIDWDDAVLAPRELDLMFVIDGVLTPLVTAQQQEWFFAGYGSTAVDLERLNYYECVRALVDVGDFSLWALDQSRSLDERQGLLEIVRGVLSPQGLVQVALRRMG